MADEPKVPPLDGTSETPARSASAEGSAAARANAAAEPAKPAATKPALKPEPWSSPLLDELQRRFPGMLSEAVIFRNLPSITVAKEMLLAVCEFLKSEEGGGYALLTDETAVDYPKREKRFEIVYHLYSFQGNDRLRLKVHAGEEEKVPSVAGIWATANWLEREVYDMFGVQYEGHPDLKRILLPEGWAGHPLRKDYDILKQDDTWVQVNLGIKSAQ
jgi:NADH-quinone oxidoreductase subunit C